MTRISDKEIEHALMPSSGLRIGKSTLFNALLDLRDARARVERLEAVLRDTFNIFKGQHTTDHPECREFGDGCGTCLYLAKVQAELEDDDGE